MAERSQSSSPFPPLAHNLYPHSSEDNEKVEDLATSLPPGVGSLTQNPPLDPSHLEHHTLDHSWSMLLALLALEPLFPGLFNESLTPSYT